MTIYSFDWTDIVQGKIEIEASSSKDAEKKLQEVLNLAAEYVGEAKNKEWVEGEDWVSYSGPHFECLPRSTRRLAETSR